MGDELSTNARSTEAGFTQPARQSVYTLQEDRRWCVKICNPHALTVDTVVTNGLVPTILSKRPFLKKGWTHIQDWVSEVK